MSCVDVINRRFRRVIVSCYLISCEVNRLTGYRVKNILIVKYIRDDIGERSVELIKEVSDLRKGKVLVRGSRSIRWCFDFLIIDFVIRFRLWPQIFYIFTLKFFL